MEIFDHLLLLLLTAFLSHLAAKRWGFLSAYLMSFIHFLFSICLVNLAHPVAAIFKDSTILGIEWTDFSRLNNLLHCDKGISVRKFLVDITSNINIEDQEMFHSWNTIEFLPTLVLDLDETLIHSSSSNEEKNRPHDFYIYDDDRRIYTKVYKRPHVDTFLQSVSRYFEVVLFTASYECYCDPIMTMFSSESVISKRLYNTSVNGHEKDLSLATSVNMPHRVIMVDNSPEACVAQHENLYLIRSYYGTSPDFELVSLMVFLVALADTEDYRSVLHRRDKYCSSIGPNSCSL